MTKRHALWTRSVLALILAVILLILMTRLFQGSSLAPVAITPANHQEPFFGAIARNQQTGNLGYAAKAKSKEQAQQSAVASCGADCAAIIWFQNSCGAYALAGGAWGAGFGASTDEAKTKALGVCQSYSKDQQCNVRLTVCSNGTVTKG